MARIDLRPGDEDKVRLDQAAARLGLPLSAFVLSAALERAQEILVREERLVSDRDRDRLLKLLDGKTPTPNATMKRAQKRHRQLIARSDD